MAGHALAIRGPLTGQGALAEGVLRALPDWFGIESALIDYVRAADELPAIVAARGEETVGFLTLKPTSACAMEVHVMAVLPGEHRRGVGRALVELAATCARSQSLALLHVKTLAPTPNDPYPPYEATRAFYAAVGFVPLEELPQVWGPEIPAC